ncbi:MAG TPA: hypothetical protein VM690_06405 [Gaiellaceae bacterium]|nr:hypothetical protein [Gaiellaceae bacterium]
MRKIGIAAGLAALAIIVAVVSGAALANGNRGAAKPESAPKQSEPAAKVYICHATGSASNPYVLIHVSSHALPAHTGHQDGHDIVLGSSPGACPQPATTQSVKAAEQTQTPPPVTPQSQEPNNSAPVSKANEPAGNDAAEASEQGEASDQNESATDEDNSASEQGEATEQNESAKDEDASASDQGEAPDQNESASDEGQSNSEQHAQSHDANGDNRSADNHSGDHHDGDGQQHAPAESGD